VAKEIPGIPPEWQNFLFCCLLHVTLPLLPLGIEYWFSGQVDEKSAVLTAAMYSMAIGLSSRNLALFGFGLIQGVLFSAAFGFLAKTPHLQSANLGAYAAIVFIMAVHVAERYNRHVVDQAPFLEFHANLNAKTLPPVKAA
jgi:F0F1-type ATP synthase membrane subunit c/vacuolar-type H+-ATPase subunit K